MAGAIAITRREMTAAELRAASGRAKSARAARRMLAIALVLEGVDRKTAARDCGMDRQTLRDWVHRYNAEGPPGLANRRSPGPPRLLGRAEGAAGGAGGGGSDPKLDGVVRWRRVDLKRWIEAEFGVVMHERTVGKQLRELGFAGCRCARATRRPTRPPRRLLKETTMRQQVASAALALGLALGAGGAHAQSGEITVWSWNIAASSLEAVDPRLQRQVSRTSRSPSRISATSRSSTARSPAAPPAATGLPDVLSIENHEAEIFWAQFPDCFADLKDARLYRGDRRGLPASSSAPSSRSATSPTRCRGTPGRW